MVNIPLKRIDKYIWEIPTSYKREMRVPAIIFADEILLEKMKSDLTLEQSVHVAQLPGIYKASIVMPDGHQGYGFPIGGVAAFDYEDGIVSPGGVGYDINCGVRLVRTNLMKEDVIPKMKELLDTLFRRVPSGVGSSGAYRISVSELDEVAIYGAKWAIDRGYGWRDDIDSCEENGQLKIADPSKVSNRAKQRGREQLGTLGSGNHFLEIQYVEKIYNPEVAKALGIVQEGQITVMIHTGSRGYGHQICSDYLKILVSARAKYNLRFPDPELAYAPLKSKEAMDYLAAMASAANFAWANRQLILNSTRKAFEEVFKTSAEDLDMHLIYDVAHNIAKIEEHKVNGTTKKVVVHRKGATRAFPPGHPAIPQKYQKTGQPVLIPGSMGTSSYVLVGTPKSMELSFGSTAHGAGRLLSRMKAKKQFWGSSVIEKLRSQGILVRAATLRVVSEEAPEAYKDVDRVVKVSHEVGIGKLVVKLRPIGVVKGCLLYTSPSPRDLSTSRMPSSA